MVARSSSADRPGRATNVSLDPRLVEEARALELNVLRARELRFIEQINAAARWLADNSEAIAASNIYATRGLPLATARLF